MVATSHTATARNRPSCRDFGSSATCWRMLPPNAGNSAYHRRAIIVMARLRDVVTMDDRVVVTIRTSPALVKRLDEAMRRRQRELGTSKWSRNDEIVAILEAARGSRGEK